MARTGLSYAALAADLGARGTAPGCHSPLLLVFHALISTGRVRRVLELGSGMSTFFLAKMLADAGGTICALENDAGWYAVNVDVMAARGIPTDGLHHAPDICDADGIVAPCGLFDLVFSDCCPVEARTGGLDVYHQWMAPDCIIIVDDCEQPALGGNVNKWAAAHGLDVSMFMSWSRGVAVMDPSGGLDGIVTYIKGAE
jgi:predicted O-methyltransferase YrrM